MLKWQQVNIYEQEKNSRSVQLSMKKKFYNLGASFNLNLASLSVSKMAAETG